MTSPPVVLAISGFDGSGGAGTLADARAIQLNGGYPCTVVTAITAQNTTRVDRVQPVAPELVRGQLDCIADDFEIAAIKVGLLPNPACVETLIECFDARRLNCPIVLDPVIHSSSGSRLSDEEAVGALVQLLLPRATLITPNIDEASNLSNVHIRDLEHVIHAGRQLVHMGCQQVLVKGGHLDDRKGTDVLCYREGHEIFEPDERREGTVRGTGCMLSSSIACYLGQDYSMRESIRSSKAFMSQVISERHHIGHGTPLTTAGIRDNHT